MRQSRRYQLAVSISRCQAGKEPERKPSQNKTLSPVIEERVFAAIGRLLVVVVNLGRCRAIELARWTDGGLTRIRPSKSGRHVPVVMVHGVRIFGVGLVQFASEDLGFLLRPSGSQVSDLAAFVRVRRTRRNSLVQCDLIGDMVPRLEVRLWRCVGEVRPHR